MGNTVRTFGVFAGGGMHDDAVSVALETLGYDVRAVGYVERDSAAAAMLLARMENQTLHPAPVWIDCISRVDARPLRGFVDLLIASAPCQPYSSAGKRRGNEDHRSHGADDAPLPHLVRIIGECEPAVVWFENVPEWFTGGFFRGFGEELCRLGFDIAPPEFVSASDVGAPHGRERVFCLLVHTERLRAWQGEQGERAGIVYGDRLADAGGAVGHADGLHEGRREGAERGPERGDAAPWAGSEVSDPKRGGRGLRLAHDDEGQPNIEGRGSGMANADGSGLRAGGLSECRDGDAHPRGDGLAVPACGGLGAVRPPPRGDGQPDGSNEPLADTQGEGQQGREPAGHGCADGRGGERGAPVRAAFPLFPPSRPVFDDELAEYCRSDRATLGTLQARIAGTAVSLRQWAGLAADGLDPTLMPAVESGVSMVADGVAVAWGNADLLRIGGNGVCPLAVADAFCALWKEHVMGSEASR